MSIKESAAEMKTAAPRLLGYRVSDEKNGDCDLLYTIENGRIENIRIWRKDTPCIGDLCLARIVKLDQAMKLAYLEIGGVRAFLSVEGIEKKEVFLQNRSFDGSLKQEDRILVKVTADSHDHKPLRVTLRFSADEEIRNAAAHRMNTGVICSDVTMEKAVGEALDRSPYARFLTEDEELYERVRQSRRGKDGAAGSGWDRQKDERVVLYDDPCIRMSNLYGLTSMLDRIRKERVHLKSGAQLVITPTEAFTVIDVNSGKHQSKKERAEEILRVNLEAAAEVAYQIGARRLGGIILVDFINMSSADDETILTKELSGALSGLTPPGRLEDITKLGIAEITRKRGEADIYEIGTLLNKTILLKS